MPTVSIIILINFHTVVTLGADTCAVFAPGRFYTTYSGGCRSSRFGHLKAAGSALKRRRAALLDRANRKRGRYRLCKARAKFGRGEIRVLNQDGLTERVMPFNDSSRKL